ncbi:MAG: hypothetical protein M0Q95_08580 [Porticoccaceae bacterium]|nr:hypothetical protein [Porticoccaceae bacterium]
MGYRDVKAQVLSCLRTGDILHESRGDIDIKNLLATGQVTLAEVVEVIGRSRGSDYRCSPHHSVDGVDVHIIQRRHEGVDWYIKWYFVEPTTVFISVHH